MKMVEKVSASMLLGSSPFKGEAGRGMGFKRRHLKPIPSLTLPLKEWESF